MRPPTFPALLLPAIIHSVTVAAIITIQGFSDAACTTHLGTLTLSANGGCQRANATWHGITLSGDGGANCRLFPFAGANCLFVEQTFGPITDGQPSGCLVPTLLGTSADGAQAFRVENW